MKDNFIEVYKNVLSKSTCDMLIKSFDTHIASAAPGVVGGGILKEEVKSSLDMNWNNVGLLTKKQYNLAINEMRDILYSKVEEYFRKYTMESEQLDHDDPNYATRAIWEKYVINHAGIHMKKYSSEKDHYVYHRDEDCADVEQFCRRLVMMFYLNDVEKGGETEFKYQGVKVKPTTGTLVIFPAGFTGKHRGNPPISGVKYIINTWLLRVAPILAENISANPDRFYLP